VFSDATLATFVDIADLVIDLAVEDSEASAGKLRVRKARKVRHLLGWRNYKIDLERRTFNYHSVPPSTEGETPNEVSSTDGDGAMDEVGQEDLTYDRGRFAEQKGVNMSCAGPYCTFGGRAIMERERLAIFAETMNTFARKYSNDLKAIAHGIKGGSKRSKAHSEEMLRSIDQQIEQMNKIGRLILNENSIHPSISGSNLDEVIQRALVDSTIPTNVGVMREPNGSMSVRMDPYLVMRALTGVVEAAIDEMPNGGSLAIKDYRDADMAVIEVSNNAGGNWNDNLSAVFEPRNGWSPAGLGLIVARKFVEAHGGQLRIHGQRGKGTTFTVRLPM
jgi:signal transduction histidine kinase